MPQGNYDHPGYLVRQMTGGVTTAGANGVSSQITFPWDVRLRNASATVRTAGTSATTGNQVIVIAIGTTYAISGTTTTTGTATQTLGTVALGTGTANTSGTSGDMNAIVKQGAVMAFKNGTDATGVADIKVEFHVDPQGSWVGI